MSYEKANGDGGADALSYYFSRVIDEYPVLDNDSVMELGAISRRGQEAKAILENGGMTDLSSAEIDLLRQTQEEGMKARNQLVLSNQRLVLSIATKSQASSGNHELIDLVQFGTLGLIRAAEKYDPEYGTKFSTYATWWIKQSIEKGKTSGKTLVPSERDLQSYRTLVWTKNEIHKKTGAANPSDEDISEHSGIDTKKVSMLGGLQTVYSLDRSIDTQEDWNSLADVIADPSANDGYAEVEDQEFIKSCLDVLNEEEQQILLMWIDVHPEHNFEGYRQKNNGVVTVRALSERLDMKPGAVRRKMEEIRRKISDHLEEAEEISYER